MKSPVFAVFAIMAMVLPFSCNKGEIDFTPAPVEITRFENDLFSISNYGLTDSIAFLEQKYPEFFPLFTTRIIEIGRPGDPGFPERLLAFKTDFTIYRAWKRVSEIFPDMAPYEQDLSQAFGRFRTYFPEKPVPRIITCMSGFNQSVITGDSLLVISLDKYLGAEESFYKLLHPPVPAYQRKDMHPGKLVPDAIYAWLITEFPFRGPKEDLLSLMIYEGRARYCVKQLLPGIEDTRLWGFTEEQMQFCLDNERSMWEYLVEQQLLFSTDRFRLNQFVNPAPFTKDFSRESPGQAVNWIGYRIVAQYMNHNKDISTEELMNMTDYRSVSNGARYNP